MGQGMDTFGKGFASEYRKQEGEVLNKEGEQGEKLFMHQWNAQTDLLNKEGEHGEKLWKEQMKKADDKERRELTEEGKRNEQIMLNQLEDQKAALERQKRDLAKDQKPLSIFGSTQEMVQHMQAGILNEIPKAHLKAAQELNKKIDNLTDIIRKTREAAVFGR